MWSFRFVDRESTISTQDMAHNGGKSSHGGGNKVGGGKGPSKYQQQLRGSGRGGDSAGLVRVQGQLERRGRKENSDRARQRLEGDRIDEIFGFKRLTEGLPRLGWLLNYLPIVSSHFSG